MASRPKRKGQGGDTDAPASTAAAQDDGPAAAAGPSTAAGASNVAACADAGAEAAAAPAASQDSGAQAGPSLAPAAATPGQREPGPGAQLLAPGPAGAGGPPSGPAAGPLSPGAVLADALDVVNDIRAMLECPICTELMLPPHVICHNGHMSCLGCYEKLRVPGTGAAGAAQAGRCPSCKEPLYAKPARCLALESAAKRIAVPCPFADHGCPQTMLYEAAAAHARTCPWRVVACGHFAGGRRCGARVCLEKMAAHWAEAHVAVRAAINDGFLEWPEPGQDGVFCVKMTNDFGSSAECMMGDYHLLLRRWRMARGGEYDIDLKQVGGNMRLGLRQFGQGPDGYSLKEAVVTLGDEDGTCFRHVLPRALAADECLADDALTAGRKPAVIMLAPQQLSYAAVETDDEIEINEGYTWMLSYRVELRFVGVEGSQA